VSEKKMIFPREEKETSKFNCLLIKWKAVLFILYYLQMTILDKHNILGIFQR
jgi:hypothetical protein